MDSGIQITPCHYDIIFINHELELAFFDEMDWNGILEIRIVIKVRNDRKRGKQNAWKPFAIFSEADDTQYVCISSLWNICDGR